MSVKALQDYTQYSKYARHNPEKERRETWYEQVERVAQMHREQLGDKLELIQEDFDFAIDMIKKKKILGSQRALQFGGSPILKKNAKIYNCTVSYVDRVDFYKECMYLLLCGCGVGFSVQTHHVAKMPKIVERTKGEETFVIPDSIEGWSDAIGVLMQSYFDDDRAFTMYDHGGVEFPSFSGKKVNFDFSLIREAGAPISWGGKAPGPQGLQNAIKNIESVIERCLEEGKDTLRAIDAYDIIMHSSDAVLSGGIRRSATICLFSPDDEEMATAKTGDWFIKNPQRGRSNNSALLIRNETTKEQFSKLMESVKQFGEPGFVWADDKEALYNPCLDGETLVKTDKGEVKLKEIVSNPENYKVLSLNEETGKMELETIKAGVKTKENTEMIRIDFDDGSFINLTPDHRVFTENRGYINASELTEEDEIVSIDEEVQQSQDSEIEVTENKYLNQSKWTTRVIQEHRVA